MAQNTLQEWISEKSYWEQYLWQICMAGQHETKSAIDEVINYLLEDVAIKPKSERPALVFGAGQSVTSNIQPDIVRLQEISALNHINAIPATEKICFSKNLTIIFGENGSGKSGISRLFSNACFSRSQRELLHNVREQPSKPSASFVLEHPSGIRNAIQYVLGAEIPELKRFYVFDPTSVVRHLDSPNNVNFVPAQLKIFDRVAKSILLVEDRLAVEKQKNQIDNPTQNLFLAESGQIPSFCSAITASTGDGEIDDMTTFDQVSKSRKNLIEQEIQSKQRLDIPEKRLRYQTLLKALQSLRKKLEAVNAVISKSRLDELNDLIDQVAHKKRLAEASSIEQFKHEDIKLIGDKRWLSLIQAAREIYEHDASAGELDNVKTCYLCQQELSSGAKSLFEKYWAFLKSTATTEFEAIKINIANLIRTLAKDEQALPEFSDVDPAVVMLSREAPAYLPIIKDSIQEIRDSLIQWQRCLSSLTKIADLKVATLELKPIDDLMQSVNNQEAALKDPSTELAQLQAELATLKQKEKISPLAKQLKKYRDFLVWQGKLDSVNFSYIKRQITTKRTEFFNETIAQDYKQHFTKECKNLNAEFGMEVYTRGAAQNSVKGLKLSFAADYSPSRILSDGEQKVCSLADFLTEVNLDKNSLGIILDDPVSSLDHARRELIAERLVKESKIRQVIILTHDIVFLLSLQACAQAEHADCATQTIRRLSGVPGITKPELPWIAQNVSSRIGSLRNDLVRITKLHKSADPDEYTREAKTWCGLLREGWERAIEERLFKTVVTRFSFGIQTQKLKYIEITKEIISEIEHGMTKTSNWVHDQAAGRNTPAPAPDILESYLADFDSFAKKCKAP